MAVYCGLWRVRAMLSGAWDAAYFTDRTYLPLAGLYISGAFHPDRCKG